MNDDTGRKTYSIPEAAKILGIGKNQAYAAAHAGEIPIIRMGNRMLVPRLALDKLLEQPINKEERQTHAA